MELGHGVLSTQVLQELCVTIRRKASHPLPIEEFSRLIENYSKWEVVVNTAASITDSLRIEARYKMSFWMRSSCRPRRVRGWKLCTPRIWRTGRSTLRCG